MIAGNFSQQHYNFCKVSNIVNKKFVLGANWLWVQHVTSLSLGSRVAWCKAHYLHHDRLPKVELFYSKHTPFKNTIVVNTVATLLHADMLSNLFVSWVEDMLVSTKLKFNDNLVAM